MGQQNRKMDTTQVAQLLGRPREYQVYESSVEDYERRRVEEFQEY